MGHDPPFPKWLTVQRGWWVGAHQLFWGIKAKAEVPVTYSRNMGKVVNVQYSHNELKLKFTMWTNGVEVHHMNKLQSKVENISDGAFQ